MGKLYGTLPSYYFGLEDNEQYMACGINLACMTAFFEDENYHYKKSKETSQNEAGAIGEVLEQYKRQMSER